MACKKMASIVAHLLILILPLMVHSQIQDDVLLDIVTNCPKTSNDSKHVGQIWVSSDFAAVVTLNCLNGNITKKDHAEVSVKFFITTDPDNTKDKDVCVMHQFPRHESFHVEVTISRRYKPLLYHPTRKSAVFCTYDPYAKARTKSLNVKFPSSPLRRIFNDKGKERTYVITMDVVNLNNRRITGALPLGLKVQLRGRIQTSPPTVSIRVDRCVAFNGIRSYEILKNGRGDGTVLPRDMGFTLINQSFYSPIFEAFQLRGSTYIQFECTIYFCDPPCRRHRLTSTTQRSPETSN